MGVQTSELGRRLYDLLPALYRNRDRGDLRRVLAAYGWLLDLTRSTLDQRLADAFPDVPTDGPACQPWLLPYFAQLLDVRLVSPDEGGRRAEIANAIAWRQRKGTLACAERIAEAVGRVECELQEGWQRVAVTPRVGLPLLPARTQGYPQEPAMAYPALAARHPGLPAVTLDLRCPSRAVRVQPGSPGSRVTRFDTERISWRQASRHGVPCLPGSFDDVSRRTLDLRPPDWRRGHAHPRRLLLHVPPPAGLFPNTGPVEELLPADRLDPSARFGYGPCRPGGEAHCARFPLQPSAVDGRLGRRGLLCVAHDGETVGIPVVVHETSGAGLGLKGPPPPEGIRFPVPASQVLLVLQEVIGDLSWEDRHDPLYRGLFGEAMEGTRPEGLYRRTFRNLTLDQEWALAIRFQGPVEINAAETDEPADYLFQGLGFDGDLIVHAGRVALERCAARKVEAHRIDTHDPVISAVDCLFGEVQAARGLSRLEYCTVLGQTLSEALQASDCIFLGMLRRHHVPLDPPSAGCVRYSRLTSGQAVGGLAHYRCTRDSVVLFSEVYGERGCGVLHPASPASVRGGAEDGGEMGAYHRQAYSLRTSALLTKLRDYLPVGIEPVVIPDPRLLEPPPAI